MSKGLSVPRDVMDMPFFIYVASIQTKLFDCCFFYYQSVSSLGFVQMISLTNTFIK